MRYPRPHFSSGFDAVKSWSMILGAIGQAWWLSVVRLNRRFAGRADHSGASAALFDADRPQSHRPAIPVSCAGCHRFHSTARRQNGMRQKNHVIALPATGGTIFPGKVAALADIENLAQPMHGELLLRLIDETESHRLPFLAKKVAARFRISRSCRRISFSRRRRFSSAATSSEPAGAGSSINRSRLRPIQRTSVESPIPNRRPLRAACVRSFAPAEPPRFQIPS